MSKKRTILAGDLMRGDSFEHNGLNALVTSVGLTPTHANVKVTIMGQKTTVRFDRDHKVRITPGPPAAKPPLGRFWNFGNSCFEILRAQHRAGSAGAHNGARRGASTGRNRLQPH